MVWGRGGMGIQCHEVQLRHHLKSLSPAASGTMVVNIVGIFTHLTEKKLLSRKTTGVRHIYVQLIAQPLTSF